MNWKTNKKCPKCGSNKFRIEEFIEVANVYEAENGEIIFEGTTDDADVKATYCYCHKCKHKWRARKEMFY